MGGEGIKVLREKVFDKSRWMQFPRDVLIGHEVIDEIPSVCRDLHLGTRAFLITGEHTMSIAGERIAELLNETCDVRCHIATAISPDEIARTENAAEDADFILGIGGGRVIDIAKIVSYNLDRQFISVPTAAAHDGVASARATVPTAGGSTSMEAHPPIAVVADTGIIAAAPRRLLASGCADIISNYTAILDWELAHRMRGEPISEYAIALSRMTAEIIVKNAGDISAHTEESAWMVMKALVSSGVAMSIAGSSRPASGGEHKFSHALDRIAPGRSLHGEQCGVGSIVTMYLHGGDWRGLRDSLRRIGAPTTPAGLGIEDEQAVEALLSARTIRPERFTILDMGLSRQSAEKIIRMLYEE
ncbi:NAD(P)-dependent glycerol-1-phosphate dehydrogenase [Methanofollis fontis]|uniref:Glycerol-1-phosphate dehydrogenase [NAD(P)+] n=1 Tax=Methanofollis fontis TaxID=2052832 RepID=A0A483CRQ3_9EURY|nr:NAD(P)-dependent glycerol-1-phosphate dehydrogenase [Methanofollis fontis]TAJ44881.1 NAD(P)-dependent glycerol-1-phosphate dehydrogenase [Methanofollis fontis]